MEKTAFHGPTLCVKWLLGPLHTREWEPVSSTLQALSLLEKAELVQVRFTLCLTDQQSMWMQDGCNVYMETYMASNGSCFMVTWTILKSHLLKEGLTQNRHTMALKNAHNHWLILIYHAWGPTWREIHWNNIWLRTRSHMTSHYTWGPATTLHALGGVCRTAFWHFLLGSHNIMVTALGSCVRWPLGPLHTQD